MSETNKIIIVFSLCSAFVVNAVMFGWEATRRSADEMVKRNQAGNIDKKEVERKAKECIGAGGLPDYYDNGNWENCT